MKKQIALLVTLAFVVLFGWQASAQTAIEKLKKEYPATMVQYGKQLQDLHTHYIIAVDASGSMTKFKDQVVPAVQQFLESLPEGDYASIVAFAGNARTECTPLKLDEKNRETLMKNLNRIYEEVIPRNELNRNSTQLYKGAEEVVKLVEEDKVSDIYFATFFTDLCDEGRQDWTPLKNRVAKLKNKNFGVVATALPAPASQEKLKNKGIDNMRNAFEGFSYSSDVNAVFGELLENYKQKIYKQELLEIIPKEFAKLFEGLTVSADIGLDKRISFHADYPEITPAIIKGVSIDTTILKDQSPDVSRVEFFPGARMSRTKKSAKIGKVEFLEKGKLFHHDPSVTVATRYHFDLPEPKTDKEPNLLQEIEQLGLKNALYSEKDVEAAGNLVIGWPFWLVCALALFLLVFLICLIKNTIIPWRIRNKQLFCKDMLGKNQPFNASGKRKFSIGNPQKCKNNDWKIQNASFLVNVKTKNGGPFNLIIKKKLVFDLEEQDGVTMIQEGKRVSKANILDGAITINDGFGRPYVFTIADLIKK